MTQREPDDVTVIARVDSTTPLLSTELQAGQSVGERYEVISVLGRGGMGLVYKVKQIFLNKEFALKTINRNSISETNLQRFQKEAVTTFELKHPNLIAVNDFGVLADQTPFLVMELIIGETLGECLKQRVRLTLQEAIPVFVQACFALKYAHDHGVVHRDIKPNNIMILSGSTWGAEGSVKVLDFGIAKFVNHEGGEIQALTRTGEIFGTPLYMSPEQCSGSRVDSRADIYSLGCVLFEALTGAAPFLGASAVHTMLKHQTEQPMTLKQSSLGADFPQEIEDIVARMLAKSPEDRYPNLGLVAHDLGALLRGDSISEFAMKSPLKPHKEFEQRMLPRSILVIAILLILSTSIFFYHQYQKDLKPITPTTLPLSDIVSDPVPRTVVTDEQLAKLPTEPYARVSLTEARTKGQSWSLQFPEQIALGQLESPEGRITEAKGPISISPPSALNLIPSSYLCERPKLFRLFRSNEIDSLNFQSKQDEVDDDVLFFISHLTGLHKLALNGCDISDRGLQHLSHMKSLKALELSKTKVSGKGLTALSLDALEEFKADRIQNAEGLTAKLSTCTQLKELSLSNDNLKDDDLKLISRCSNLQILHISNLNKITDRGVAYLVKLKNLRELDLTDCKTTDKSLRSFEQMQLHTLFLTPIGWSKPALRKLQSLFAPETETANGGLRVSRKYYYLFDPAKPHE